MRTLGLGLIVLSVSSCSAVVDKEDTTAVGTEEESLSNSEHCQDAPADLPTIATFEFFHQFDPPYGSVNCAKAVLLDVTPPLGHTGHAAVRWFDDLPTNPTDCANASLWSYSWLNNVGWDDEIVHGTWSGSVCLIPNIVTSIPGPPFGRPFSTYRFAISARQGNSLRTVQFTADADTPLN